MTDAISILKIFQYRSEHLIFVKSFINRLYL